MTVLHKHFKSLRYVNELFNDDKDMLFGFYIFESNYQHTFFISDFSWSWPQSLIGLYEETL